MLAKNSSRVRAESDLDFLETRDIKEILVGRGCSNRHTLF